MFALSGSLAERLCAEVGEHWRFRTVDRKTKQLGANRPARQRAWAKVKRRAKKAGIDTPGICNHTFRGTGITA